MTKCCKHYKLKREINIVGKIEGNIYLQHIFASIVPSLMLNNSLNSCFNLFFELSMML